MIAETIALTEHLLRRSRRKLLAPWEKLMAAIVLLALKGERQHFVTLYNEASEQAFAAGVLVTAASLGMSELNSSARLSFGRPIRTPQIAISQIDWTDPDTSAERVKKIAEYEISQAFHDGQRSMANYAQSSGMDLEKRWYAQPDACAICQGNADQDWVPEGMAFDSGDFVAPAHLHCRCACEYREMKPPYALTGTYS